jgi:hypothetical protein
MNWVYYYFSRFADLANPLPDVPTEGRLQIILNTVLAVTGAIAVLIIVIAGFKYIISQGNPSDVATARNAIIYALVGLIVIMFAFAIVNFVLEGLS